MQVKLEKIMQLYEDLKQNGLTELNDLRAKYDEATGSKTVAREARPHSIEGSAGLNNHAPEKRQWVSHFFFCLSRPATKIR